MNPNYWPTTPLTRAQHARAIKRATTQDAFVMAVMRRAKRPQSPRQVFAVARNHGRNWELTSIRRSMTTLARANALVHLHNETRMGEAGARETLWALPVGRVA